MLPIRDPSQDKRLAQTESEGLKTNFPSKGTGKKSRGSNTHIRQNRLPKKAHKERPRRSLHNSQRKNPPRREWQKKFQVMKTRGLQPRQLYSARLSIKIEGQIKSFQDKRSLKEYTSTKPALQEMLKGLL